MTTKKNTGGRRRTYDVPRTDPPQRPKTQDSAPRTGKKRRRRVKAKVKLVTFLFLFAVVVTFIVLSLTVLFRMESFEIAGETPYTQEEIFAAAGISHGENLFLMDRQAAERRLEESLPYISKARLRIVLPNTLKFQLTKGTAAMLLKTDGGNFLLDEQGKVLESIINEELAEGLLKVENLETTAVHVGKTVEFARPQALDILLQVHRTLKTHAFEKISRVKFSEALSVTLGFDDRIDIILGAAVNLDYKITNAKLLLEQHIAADEKGTLDFSVNEDQPIFDPWYDTPSIQVPPGGSLPSEEESTTSSSEPVSEREE